MALAFNFFVRYAQIKSVFDSFFWKATILTFTKSCDKMKTKKRKGSLFMAKRRMLHPDLLQSDDFISLSSQTQLLYVHLNLLADDDGVVNNHLSVMRMLGIGKTKLAPLIEKGYILKLKCGLLVITHWRLHNKIRPDRYQTTRFPEVFSEIESDDLLYRFKKESEI